MGKLAKRRRTEKRRAKEKARVMWTKACRDLALDEGRARQKAEAELAYIKDRILALVPHSAVVPPALRAAAMAGNVTAMWQIFLEVHKLEREQEREQAIHFIVLPPQPDGRPPQRWAVSYVVSDDAVSRMRDPQQLVENITRAMSSKIAEHLVPKRR